MENGTTKGRWVEEKFKFTHFIQKCVNVCNAHTIFYVQKLIAQPCTLLFFNVVQLNKTLLCSWYMNWL